MEPIGKECNSGKYDLKAELYYVDKALRDILNDQGTYWHSVLDRFDFLIIPADRTEMTEFAYKIFKTNRKPFCHYLAGSQTFSYCHDDTNRFLISLMANFCFAESPEAAENLKRVGMPEDRILVTGTSHFDGITMQDIEAHKPKDIPDDYDLQLLNPITQVEGSVLEFKPIFQTIIIKPNEDSKVDMGTQYSHLEFLYLLKHCHNFISNSSAIHYEVPYLNKFCGANIKVINPSIRNSIRTSIPPEYCRGASRIISKWAESVDLSWLRSPKHLFYQHDINLLGLPK